MKYILFAFVFLTSFAFSQSDDLKNVTNYPYPPILGAGSGSGGTSVWDENGNAVYWQDSTWVKIVKGGDVSIGGDLNLADGKDVYLVAAVANYGHGLKFGSTGKVGVFYGPGPNGIQVKGFNSLSYYMNNTQIGSVTGSAAALSSWYGNANAALDTNTFVFGSYNRILAGGYGSVIAGGTSNVITAGLCSFAYGYDNEINAPSDIGIFVGGYKSTATGNVSFAHGNGSVASGDNSVAFGLGSSVGGIGSFVAGIQNYVLGRNSVSFGRSNDVLDSSSVAFGSYNLASGAASTVVGGSSNTASGARSIAGGLDNIASGATSVAMGNGNTAAGGSSVVFGQANTQSQGNQPYCTISGGQANIINSPSSTIGGGQSNAIGESYYDAQFAVIPGGNYAYARHYGAWAMANGRFAANGDNQTMQLRMFKTTTGATQDTLTLSGIVDDWNHTRPRAYRAVLDTGTTWTFSVLLNSRSDGGSSAGYKFEGVIKNVAGTTSIVGSVTKTVLAEDDAAWDADVIANDTSDALSVVVTGAALVNIRWSATINITQTQW